MKTNRFISLLLCVVMIMSLFTGLAGSASADDIITHEVQSGEILMKICEKYGLNYYNSKNAIMQLNGFTSEAQLARLTAYCTKHGLKKAQVLMKGFEELEKQDREADQGR